MKTALWPKNRFLMTFPNTLDALPIVLSFVHSCALQMGFEESAVSSIEIATEEAVVNVLQHAYLPQEEACFFVECNRRPDGIEVVVRDMGRPFDPESLPQYDEKKLTGLLPAEGLGSFLEKRLMDSVEYHQLGAMGKEVRLFKQLPGDYEPEARDAVSVSQAVPLSLSEEDLKNCQVRRMKPEEAVEVSRLAYDSYQYSYGYEKIYSPKLLRSMNEEGMIRSYVAVSPNGMVLGHLAILFSPERPRIVELGVGVIKPDVRGHRLFGMLNDRVIQDVIELGLFGFFVTAVTTHVGSQKNAAPLGLSPTGMMLARVGNVVFKKIREDMAQRESFLAYFRKIGERPCPTVYPPKAHRAMIDSIYKGCAIDVRFSDEGPHQSPGEEAQVDVSIDSVHNLGSLNIVRSGKDLSNRVRHALHSFKLAGILVACAHLDLSDPFTLSACETLEAAGFFFGGILPGGTKEGNDLLFLNCLLGCAVHYDQIRIFGDQAQSLFDYVQQLDPLLR